MITGKINLSKVDKEKLFKGEKGIYLDVILWETPNSEYGDYMIKQGVSKEDRDAGYQSEIIGNAKIRTSGGAPSEEEKESLPF